MRILILFFSATGNTAHIASVIRDRFVELGADADAVDITPFAERQSGIGIDPYDAVVFSFPVHSWRASRVVRDWLATLEGRQKKCSLFFTFGGFGIHPAHQSTREILEDRGFVVVSSAEFPAAHTFNLGGWRAMMGRPDEQDFLVAGEYALKTYHRFTGQDHHLPGPWEATPCTGEYLDALEAFRFTVVTQLPSRDRDGCSMCRICEAACPTGAMDAELGNADPARCIACLGCVFRCPESALRINDMSVSWSKKIAAEKTSIEEMVTKKSRIYL